MKLNKYQKLWIDRLRSGKTRKCRLKLSNGSGGNCCLGVAINVCRLEKMKPRNINSCEDEDLSNYNLTREKLKIEKSGTFNYNKVSSEWKKKLNEANVEVYNLISLNDDTKMTHKDIGDFINENREAVFIG